MGDLLDYKCPACGGALEFDSSIQKMKCPFCDTTYDMEELKSQDDVLDEKTAEETEHNWSKPDNQWAEGETDNMSVFTCQSCGGEIIGDDNTAATSCPFCGNPVVITGRFSGTLKPDYVIPFKLDKKAAKEQYFNHIKGKFLLPKLFKDENHIDEIKGIYVPFWIFDSDISASASFVGENVRTWSDSKYNYTETSYYDIFRAGDMSFRHIPVDGSSKIADDLMESIEPFDFNDAVPFQTAYLAGYFADKYDVDEKSSEPRANHRIFNSAKEVLADTCRYNYTSVRDGDSNIFDDILKNKVDDKSDYIPNEGSSSMVVKNGDVKYALYPVWMLTTTYKGEKYTFAMNGQTGRFVGDLPCDKKKKNGLFAGVFAAASAIATALIYLFLG